MSNANAALEEARQTKLQAEAESRQRESMQTLASNRRKRGEIVSPALAAHEGGSK